MPSRIVGYAADLVSYGGGDKNRGLTAAVDVVPKINLG